MRWVLTKTNDEYLTYLSRKANISRTLAQILIGRGIKDPSQVRDFLNPSLSLLSDPFSIAGVKEATERIRHAIKHNERILIHGDYDADGLSGTALMVEGLRRLGADVHFFIPSRLVHGYGFNEPGLKKALEIGASLIITVDCGIKSFNTALETKKKGIDLIITDHHLPHFTDNLPLIPEAIAVINPKISPSSEELVHLSGSGVAFKVLEGLYRDISELKDLLDLVAVGTVGDIVPLIGENRNIVKEGLFSLKYTERKGLRALIEITGIKDRFSSSSLSFTLIPRLNAAGRLEDPTDVVNLLLTQDELEAERLSSWLDSLNRQRQEIEEEIYYEAMELLRDKYNEIPDVIVLYKEGWHPGVVGIIASKIQEEFFRPAFIFSVKDGVAIGSVRSIPHVDIIKILDSLERFLIRYGGHSQAAGLSLYEKDINMFELSVQEKVREILKGERPIPILKIDAEVRFNEINFSLLKELENLEPLGYGNEEPILGAREIHPVESRIVGNGHLKLKLRQEGNEFDVIGFKMAEMIELTSEPVDIAFLPRINEFNGKKKIQLKIRAIRKSEVRPQP